MQSAPTEHSQNASVSPNTPEPSSPTQHGLFGDPSELSTPPLLPSGERGSVGGSSTEWSLSPTSELASPGSSDFAGLSPRQPDYDNELTDFDLENLRLSLTPTVSAIGRRYTASNLSGNECLSTLHDFPEGKSIVLSLQMFANVKQNFSSKSCHTCRPKTF